MPRTARTSTNHAVRSGGFTLVELLVVMFVIAMLLTVGVAYARSVYIQSKINACRVTVNIIDNAVDQYQEEHKRYPDMAEMAARLIGQSFKTVGNTMTEVDDGHPGPGYRLQKRGPVYGPWNGVDKLSRTGDYVEGASSARVHFIDAFGTPIWYCPFKDSTYTDSEFDRSDSEDGANIASIADYARDASGRFYRRDYIVMSQSADGKWGLLRGTSTSSNTVPTDDVTNFTK